MGGWNSGLSSLEVIAEMTSNASHPTRARFSKKFDGSNPGSCWVWTAAKAHHGYGKFKIGDKLWAAHRVAYWLRRGPIPDGLTLDHLCRNPSCVNPEHLEPVSATENKRRGALARRNAAQ